MSENFDCQIAAALGTDLGVDLAPGRVIRSGAGGLRSAFDVTGLALASVGAAAGEVAALAGGEARVDRRAALQWFAMSLRPIGWQMPGMWDPIAGDYKAADGWIRLHTNAPHHRAAALSVLDCASERGAVTEAVSGWQAQALEEAVVAANGCAAAMRELAGWAVHPQGAAVAQEPLVAWRAITASARSVRLRGLKVLDLTRVLAGPVATRFLAGFGADVLRIDPPGWEEPGIEPEVTLGKRCAGLDLRQSDDRARFEALLRDADVLVHGYRPGALDRLGFGARARTRLNPDLIDMALDAYGWTGPWAARRGFDSLVQMSCGIAAEGMVQFGADRPRPLPVQALDHATGYLMAATVLRALRLRATGQVMSARLSLARVAALLISGGVAVSDEGLQPETEADLAPQIEQTSWGPARRIRFPVSLNGEAPHWSRPAGRFRAGPANWR